MNRIILIGRLVERPKLQYFPDGDRRPFCILRIGVDSRYKAKGTEFFRATAYDSEAEGAHRHLRRGSKVAIEGRLSLRKYNSGGQWRAILDIIAEHVEYLARPNTLDPKVDDDEPIEPTTKLKERKSRKKN